jgi:cyclopropane fatty-acyl-phospholipid synthase-like methyltransferase
MNGDFVANARQKLPAKLLTDWLPRLKLGGGNALDLGCGAGAEAEWLARNGFTIDAVEKSPVMAKAARDRCQGLSVNVVEGDFLDFNFELGKYQLVTAINALPFVAKDRCRMLIEDIQESVAPGGAVILAVYGPEHSWADRADMSFWTKDEFAAVWHDWIVLNLEEFRGEWPLVSGETVFQHRIHLVAQKPQ